jgi:hypothetical protein
LFGEKHPKSAGNLHIASTKEHHHEQEENAQLRANAT